MSDVLLPVFNRLGDYASKYKVISEGELRLRIRESLELESLSAREREELENSLGGNLEELIFNSITTRENKISVFSPDMHTKINYQGEVFYCLPTHRYMSAELEDAFLRWSAIKNPPDKVKVVVMDFMHRAGYQIQTQEVRNLAICGQYGNCKCKCKCIELLAVKSSDKHLRILVLSSIKFVPYLMGDNSATAANSDVDVMVVPTEKTPAPFISFFREHDVGEMMIWVADVERHTLDPFIGIPQDKDIESNFTNPDKARRAVSVWMKKMRILDF